ncbi:hypothetical protein [Schinkia azotoformans]|uniref:hypothetical protein n=1 Tax=Schinkia azotoformans TaxID=1454 RepID=UPI002DB8F42E|nr:hypothetical protein [Schinkia azotoformans]MEC1714896.1 hypothetical protein [Schinkia azotoformans]MEC1747576.1 hypothetical protein [Schinkia azotoformans]MEC1759340.1 hypothetical protein [Schinkia azotoformans]MED4377108.1 hypothetical protein [Schinkia azotoformans]
MKRKVLIATLIIASITYITFVFLNSKEDFALLNDVDSEEILLINDKKSNYQTIKDLTNEIEIKVEDLSFYGVAKDQKEQYWLITEGNNNNNYQRQLVSYNFKGKKIHEINLQEEIPNEIKAIDNTILLSVISNANKNRLYLYDTNANLLEKVEMNGYIWDFQKESSMIFIAVHDTVKNIGKLYVYNMKNKELKERVLVEQFAPVSFYMDDR